MLLCLVVLVPLATTAACTGPGYNPTSDPFTDQSGSQDRRDAARRSFR
jgi:hypothetical protein